MDYSGIKILVVDDEPDILEFITYNLSKEGFKVSTAQNGHEALEVAKRDHPHIMILDIMMPEMDGYEVCERLKGDERTRDIPVIFLTAKSEVEDERKGFALGAVDYITKPISPPLLLARVATHLQLKEARDFLQLPMTRSLK